MRRVEGRHQRREGEEAVRKSETRLAEAQRLAHLGGWEWDVQADKISWSDEVYRIYGLPPQSTAPSYERFMTIVHPDDRMRLRRTIDEALNGSEPYDVEHRVVRPDGKVRVVHRRAEVVRGEGGEPLRMIGTVHDITERKEAEERLRAAEERYRTVVEEQTELVCRFLPDLTLTFVNEAYCRYFGGDPRNIHRQQLHRAGAGRGSRLLRRTSRLAQSGPPQEDGGTQGPEGRW